MSECAVEGEYVVLVRVHVASSGLGDAYGAIVLIHIAPPHCNERILSPRPILLRNDMDYKFPAFQ